MANIPTWMRFIFRARCSTQYRFSTSWKAELNLPIVASNPAMLWLVLSKLGLRYRSPATASCWQHGQPFRGSILFDMRTVRLAYRDHDRTPVIYCIKAMAERHYDIHVEVLHIEPSVSFRSRLVQRPLRRHHRTYRIPTHRSPPRENQSRCFARRRFTVASTGGAARISTPSTISEEDDGRARPRPPLRITLWLRKWAWKTPLER